VVGVTDDPPVRQALLATRLTPHRGTHRPAGAPGPVDVLVERVQGDVREQRGEHAPNAMGNFCFEVTLGYRRLERPRRGGQGV
ncbi:MAG TPA: hypothetical protein VI357_11930, partial [Mycobacteriales bacterium]